MKKREKSSDKKVLLLRDTKSLIGELYVEIPARSRTGSVTQPHVEKFRQEGGAQMRVA